MYRLLALVIVAVPLQAGDREALLKDVKTLACPGLPGPVCVFGESATPLVAVGADTVIACGSTGPGRVVAFGHDGYFDAASLKVGDTKQLLLNAIRWAGRDAKTIIVSVRGYPEFAKNISGDDIQYGEDKPNVILLNPSRVRSDEVKQYADYLANGGGIITGIPGWGWRQTHKDQSLANDFPLNRVLAQAGLAIADGTIAKPRSGTIEVAPVDIAANAHHALAMLESWLSGGDSPRAAEATLMQGAVASLGSVPDEFAKPLNERLTALLTQAGKRLPVPTSRKPLTQANAAERLLMTLSTRVMLKQPVEQCKPHPAAAVFPGAVADTAPRVTKNLTLEISHKGYICNGYGVSATADIWHGTGLYAAPGEVVTITVPESVLAHKLGVRIGAHTDTLWHLNSWQRAPEITRQFQLDRATIKVANPFGGLIYITAPYLLDRCRLEVTIANAVAAPHFVLDRSTAASWSESRQSAAPWAELSSKKIALTIPSEIARALDDPAEILRFWDQVMDCDADLTGVSRERGRAERLVHDVQISAGYMHSGYPIMCPLNEANRAVDLARIQREGAWGYFHELGHNHQQKEWTFHGTVEVTCNLYSLYCFDKLCPKSPLHDAMRPESIRKHATKYFQDPRFAAWQEDPFTALIMYRQMQEAFGWETYRKAIAKYHELKLSPRGDAARRDEWMVQMSLAADRNLAPFFDHWRVPVSDAAKKKVAELKEWKFPDATK